MRILIWLATLALGAGLLATAAKAADPSRWIPFRPEVVPFVPGMTELEAVRLHRDLLPLGRRFAELKEGGISGEKLTTLRGLADEYTALMRDRLTPEQYEAACRLPRDKAEAHRYYRKVAVDFPGLSPDQKAFLQRAAALADRVENQAAGDEAAAEQARRRFWELAALVLEPGQMAALNRKLPEIARRAGRSPQDYLFLPGLDASQGNRILALFKGLEAETAAGRTRLQELEGRAKAEADPVRKMALEEELVGLRLELLERREAARQDLEALLTPEQRAFLEAQPPLVPAHEFQRTAGRLVQPAGLTPEQIALIREDGEALKADFEAVKGDLEARRQAFQETELTEPGGMEKLIALRDVAEDLHRRRFDLARRLAPRLEDQQVVAFLSGRLPSGEGP